MFAIIGFRTSSTHLLPPHSHLEENSFHSPSMSSPYITGCTAVLVSSAQFQIIYQLHFQMMQ